MVINERSRKVLSQVITLHYATCEPVGSAMVSKSRVVPLSPATIRNIMMHLESGGYLKQPYTSAGRLPTDLGYRCYVDEIQFSGEDLDQADRAILAREIEAAKSPPAVLGVIADYIHRKTGLVTFHMPFRHSGLKLKHVHFERISRDRLLVLWVSRGGHSFQSILNLDEFQIQNLMVEKTENFFNQAFRDHNLIEIQQGLGKRISMSSVGEWDLLLSKSALIAHALDEEARRFESFAYQGLTTVLEMPELQNMNRVKVMFGLLEKQTQIRDLIQKTMENEDQWLMFFIGEELPDPDLDYLTVILAKIRNERDVLGCVGILGPKRMPYQRALQYLSCAKENVAAQVF